MRHDWAFVSGSSQQPDGELVSGVIAVCRRCGEIRSASRYEERLDLGGTCSPADEPGMSPGPGRREAEL